MKSLRIIIETVKTFYDEAFNLLLMCTVTVLASLPIITIPFAFGGLWAAGQRAVRGYGIKWSNYWDGVKEYGWRNLGLILILLLGYVVGLTNLWFYFTPEVSPFPPNISQWITPIWIVLLAIWTGITFYANALLVELQEPKLGLILRNSLFMCILHPLSTIVFLILTAVLIGLSIMLPVLILLTPAFILVLRLTAVRMLIQAAVEQKAEFDRLDEEKDEAEEKADA